MATLRISPNQDTIVAEIFIAAPPGRVFQALTDPEQMPRWWGQEGIYRITEAKADLRPGGKWSSVGVGADGKSFRVEGEYLEFHAPRLLVYTWMASWTGSLKTVVYWELQPQSVHDLHPKGPKKAGTGTLVKLRHQGFAAAPGVVTSHAEGWKRVMGWLESYLERNETVDTRK
jgi:uncharacterized protein YndB with AHSA1/START domain